LLVTDCDEVLLHMVAHFAEWLGEAHDHDFVLEEEGFLNAVRDRKTGTPVPHSRVISLLDGFFDSEMHRQNVVPGAVEALSRIAEVADVVILTNLGNEYQASRVAQLEAFDIRHEVLCNSGGKGRPVRELLERYQPSVAVFVDDLAPHHRSVAEHAPDVWRLHMIAEPKIAAHMPPAPDAHARIDDWPSACAWILDKFDRPAAP
jgi:hypothetical protein